MLVLRLGSKLLLTGKNILKIKTMKMSYKIWFDTKNIYLQNNNGNTGYLPLEDYKLLLNASNEERNQDEFSPFGIHWTKLDEDLCFDGFIWKQ
jgi:hypothetical protein